MRAFIRLFIAGTALTLTGCSEDINESPLAPAAKTSTGIDPHILAGDIAPADKTAVSAWIDEAVALFKSPTFETNFKRASLRFPDVYVSESQDIIPSDLLLKRLKRQDPRNTGLSWPKTRVVLDGSSAPRTPDRSGFGFEGSRKATAGPFPSDAVETPTGQIKIGRLHLARYMQGDIVEKSCALNTLIHEISHTLSDTPDKYWMHILDSQRGVTPPRGTFEASYFIGVVAQCTYLENKGRIQPADFESCMATFSDPTAASRFRSSACDDFPGNTPITPGGRLSP